MMGFNSVPILPQHFAEAQARDLPILSDLAIVTKMDLATAVEFDYATSYSNIQAVRPGMQVFQLSAKTGQGLDIYLDFLVTRLMELRSAVVV
jgi:hydrogenase nickel incorporation protein HypB